MASILFGRMDCALCSWCHHLFFRREAVFLVVDHPQSSYPAHMGGLYRATLPIFGKLGREQLAIRLFSII